MSQLVGGLEDHHLPALVRHHEEDVDRGHVREPWQKIHVSPYLLAQWGVPLGAPIPFQVEGVPLVACQVDAKCVGTWHPVPFAGRRLAVLGSNRVLADPGVQPSITVISRLAGEPGHEAVGFEVVGGPPDIGLCLPRPLDEWSRIVRAGSGEDAGAARGAEAEGGEPGQSRAVDEPPAVEDTEGTELLETGLSRAEAGEEEVCDLLGVEVAVIVESFEDDEV